MMWGSNGFGFGYGGGAMGIGMVLLFGLIIFVVVMAIRGMGGRCDGTESRQKSALDILEERYAKGEIGQAEFAEKRNDLVGSGGTRG